MKLKKAGKSSSKNNLVNITPFGLWVLIDKKEYYLKHRDFPWFRNANVDDVLNVKLLRSDHLYWPKLDVDLHLDTIINPKNYPLVAKPLQAAEKKKTA